MSVPDGEQGSAWIEAVSLLVLAATLAPWVWIVRRLVARRPVLPYQPRRPVPWEPLDIVAVLAVLLHRRLWLVFLCERPLLDGWAREHYAGLSVPAKLRARTPLMQALAADPTPVTLVVCFLSAVVAAPIAEEFLLPPLVAGVAGAAGAALAAIRAGPAPAPAGGDLDRPRVCGLRRYPLPHGPAGRRQAGRGLGVLRDGCRRNRQLARGRLWRRPVADPDGGDGSGLGLRAREVLGRRATWAWWPRWP